MQDYPFTFIMTITFAAIHREKTQKVAKQKSKLTLKK